MGGAATGSAPVLDGVQVKLPQVMVVVVTGGGGSSSAGMLGTTGGDSTATSLSTYMQKF